MMTIDAPATAGVFRMGRKARQKLTRTAPEPVVAVAPDAPPVPAAWTVREWTIAALLLALTFVVFGQVASHAFLNFDDGQFVYENQHVLNRDVAWALTSAENRAVNGGTPEPALRPSSTSPVAVESNSRTAVT